MALDFARMMLQPTQTSPWNLGRGGGGSTSLERQRLELARQQMELEQKKLAEQQKQHDLAQKAEEARAAALVEKERLDREATAQAALLEKQQGAVQKFGELAGSGKVEAAQAMVPYLDQLGYSVQDLGGIGGLPVFELNNRAEQAAKESADWEKQPRPLDTLDGGESATGSLARMGSMGYDESRERGQLDQPQGIGSTEAAFGAALQASQQAQEAGGLPARAPDEEDYTGAVPRNVIDLPAQQQATLARLRPMLGAIQESYPDAYQGSAGKTGEAVMGSGLGAIDSLALFKDLRQSPDELIKAGMQADAQKEQFREKRDELTPKDISVLRARGENSAQALAKEYNVKGAAQAITTSDEILDLLHDDNPENDTMIAGALMTLQDIKGIPSDKDLAMAFGMDKASTITQVLDFIGTKVSGGFQPEQRRAIESFVKRVTETQRQKAYDFLDSVDTVGDLNEHERVGYRGGVLRAVPGWLRAEYEEDRKDSKRKKADAGAALLGTDKSSRYDPGDVSGDFDADLETLAAEAGLDPDKVRGIIGSESGGKAGAVNGKSGATGLIQFMPEIAKDLGTSTEELKTMSPSEQLPFVMKYFSDRGITSESAPEDYAMAVAAPSFIGKPPETVVYPKGSKAWRDNAPWRPADGGDITVGSIQAYYQRGKGKSAEAPKAALPEPTTEAEKRIKALMEREGR